tara:strand:+ start:2465 stop:3700 length:1236 start_codon:yes stop_codon:yes gene_type:complete
MGNKVLKSCRVCFSNKLVNYLDLGRQPFSNSFLNRKDIKKERKFPLIVVRCKNCGLSQLSIVPDTKFIFNKYDYLSSSSKALSNHYEKLINKIVKKYNLKFNETMVDVGCNDGILLKHYPKKFKKIVGIEPSDASNNIKDKRIKLIKKFFNYQTSKEYLKKNDKPKIITITNVLAQIENLNEFVKGLNNISDNKTLIIIEFPYLLHMIDKGLFDLIYHEHLSYFALTPLKFLFNKFGIKIIDFDQLDLGASGPAIRLYLSKNGSNYKTSKKVTKQIKYEKKWGIKKNKKYNFFKKKTNLKIEKIRKIIYKKYYQGFKIGCYTASSKGNTLLNCLKLNKQIISFASENNKKKIGKYTPGTHIKIISDKNFISKKINYAILLSWNYKKFFLSKSDYIKKGGKFIIPLPIPEVK